MNVKRIVANLESATPENAQRFYQDIFGLTLAMDHGWFKTFVGESEMPIQLSIASEGGSGTQVPTLSIEVDDLDTCIARINKAEIKIEYGPVDEPWGLRRLYIRDPLGNLLNVLEHH